MKIRRAGLAAIVASAGIALGFLFPVSVHATEGPPIDNTNEVPFWCGDVLHGVKYDNLNSTSFVVPPNLPGQVWTLLVLKAGSDQSVPNENETFVNPVVGQSYSHSSGKTLSHAILCFGPAPTTTTVVVTNPNTVPTTTIASTTTHVTYPTTTHPSTTLPTTTTVTSPSTTLATTTTATTLPTTTTVTTLPTTTTVTTLPTTTTVTTLPTTTTVVVTNPQTVPTTPTTLATTTTQQTGCIGCTVPTTPTTLATTTTATTLATTTSSPNRAEVIPEDTIAVATTVVNTTQPPTLPVTGSDPNMLLMFGGLAIGGGILLTGVKPRGRRS